MKKLLIIIMSLSIFTAAFGQRLRSAQTGMAVLEIGDETKAAFRLNINPEFKFSKLSFGLKLSAYFGDEGLVDVNDDGENDIDDMEYGVRYIAWNGDAVKLKYGAIDNLTIGHGSLMYQYSNNEQTGIYGEFNYIQDEEKVMGASVLIPLKRNVLGNPTEEEEEPRAKGFRVYLRPLKLATQIPVLSNLEFGMTIFQDNKDEFYNISDDGEYKTNEYGNAISVSGNVEGKSMELALPLIEGENLNLIAYFDSVKVEGEKDGDAKGAVDGSGNFVGVLGNLSFVDYKFEYRKMDENLKANYFGTFYETKYSEYLEKLLQGGEEEVTGYFGSVNFNFGEAVDFDLSYEDYESEISVPYLSAEINIIANEKIHGFVSYQQDDFGNDGFLNENTLIKAGVSAPSIFLGIPGPFNADLDVEQKYYYDEGKNKYEAFRSYSLSLSLLF